mgnify:CR=1 FL=1
MIFSQNLYEINVKQNEPFFFTKFLNLIFTFYGNLEVWLQDDIFSVSAIYAAIDFSAAKKILFLRQILGLLVTLGEVIRDVFVRNEQIKTLNMR